MATNCSIAGCDKRRLAKGLCSKHYERVKKYGDPFTRRKIGNGEALSFLQMAARSDDDGDCLIWPFARNEFGYGRVMFRGAIRSAHRAVCTLAHGEPPTPGHVAAHSCGNGHEGCVNPHHLRWDTREGNEADRLEHGTSNRGERHGQAKLTEDSVRQIRKMQGAFFQREIAEMFGITRSHVSLIQSRKSWEWLG